MRKALAIMALVAAMFEAVTYKMVRLWDKDRENLYLCSHYELDYPNHCRPV